MLLEQLGILHWICCLRIIDTNIGFEKYFLRTQIRPMAIYFMNKARKLLYDHMGTYTSCIAYKIDHTQTKI